MTIKISLVTTCMGRLDQLRRTLPQRIHPEVETIVVDWSCPNNCSDWIRAHYTEEQVKIVRVDGETHYNAGASRKIGTENATADWVAMVDADLFVDIDELLALVPSFTGDNYYVRMPTDIINSRRPFKMAWINGSRYRLWQYEDGTPDQEKIQTFGFLVFPKKALEICNYDETYGYTYGHEDVDFRYSLFFSCVYQENILPSGIIDIIQHPNHRRIEFMTDKPQAEHAFQRITRQIFFSKWGRMNNGGLRVKATRAIFPRDPEIIAS